MRRVDLLGLKGRVVLGLGLGTFLLVLPAPICAQDSAVAVEEPAAGDAAASSGAAESRDTEASGDDAAQVEGADGSAGDDAVSDAVSDAGEETASGAPAPSGEGAATGDSEPALAAAPAASSEAASDAASDESLPEDRAPELPDPATSANLLEEAAPDPETVQGWTSPVPVFALHGYLRLRGNQISDLSLGRNADPGPGPGLGLGRDPFLDFRSADARSYGDEIEGAVSGGCSDEPGAAGGCEGGSLLNADLRLRLAPEWYLSDDVRVKSRIDVLDNVPFGVGIDDPAHDSAGMLVVRRAWAEVRNRDLGELRFGRMGADWGLGILHNGGDRSGIDSDFSTEFDRVMALSNVAGFYLMAAYDWAARGDQTAALESPSGLPLDSARDDALHQVTLSAARMRSPGQMEAALARGETVLNAGAYFVYRSQLLGVADSEDGAPYTRVGAVSYTPDLWLQLRTPELRVELEAAYVMGSREGACAGALPDANGVPESALMVEGAASGETCDAQRLGAALESEYRLFDQQLGIHLNAGFASGDSDSYGLAASNATDLQRVDGEGESPDSTLHTFEFHPDYRVDLLLWRTLMGRVAGAYYINPAINYDFIRNPYGSLLGGRLDVIYSRAAVENQSWGRDANLGVELDVSLYYRSEDGPDPEDGFHVMAQWGVLFPLDGLREFGASENPDNAMILRAVAGVSY